LYITHTDLLNAENLQNKMVFCVNAPPGTSIKIQPKDVDEDYR